MIALGVRDMAAAVKFYETGRGLPRPESPPEVAYNPYFWIGPADN